MLVPLEVIVENAHSNGLPTLEQVSNGYRHNEHESGMARDNPRMFAWQILTGSDYLIEAVKHWCEQVVVDCGCGMSVDGYTIAKIAGARAYVAVDPFNMKEFYERITDPEQKRGEMELNERIAKMKKFIPTVNSYDAEVVERVLRNIEAHERGSEIPVAIVAEDIVSALGRLPDSSVSILTAGLDRCILWRDEYAERAEAEIVRALHLDGAYLAVASRLAPKSLVRDALFPQDGSFKKFTKAE